MHLRAEGVGWGEQALYEMGLTGSWNARGGGGGGLEGGVREWGRRQGGVDTNSLSSLSLLPFLQNRRGH